MKIDILTIFPEMFAPLKTSMLSKAAEKGLISIETHNIRDYSENKHKRTDDYPFGGGEGMLMTCDPVFRSLEAVDASKKRIVYMSPKGRIIDRDILGEYAKEEELVILCGHYEGIDERILDAWDIDEISVGDYVLTGGEPAAIVFVDAMARLIPGFLSSEEAALEESVYSGLLEYPQYTKPREYRGMKVPEVLVSGNHKLIEMWKFEMALRITKERRPDLFEAFCERSDELSREQKKVMEKVQELL
jgi:tRNA (guanine37-N1)-methyltransferase